MKVTAADDDFIYLLPMSVSALTKAHSGQHFNAGKQIYFTSNSNSNQLEVDSQPCVVWA